MKAHDPHPQPRPLRDPAATPQPADNKSDTSAPCVFDQVSAHPGLVVLRDIESGYQCGFWLLDMQPAELEAWWHDRESFWWPSTRKDNEELARIFGEPPEPARPPMELPGTFLRADTDEALSLWNRLSQIGRHYICNLCCDADSWLTAPDGRRIYHRGFCGDPLPPREAVGEHEPGSGTQ